jgi:alkaline phosphatase D
MMRIQLIGFLLLFSASSYSQQEVKAIAFGSCSNQNKDLSIFDTILFRQPDVFIYLGDNIYADTENMRIMRKKYRTLKTNPHYKNFAAHTPIIATWDDHDYGMNDSGRHYPKKEGSKKNFLKFFKEPKHSERYDHEGIYTTYNYTSDGKNIQVILLDLRTFRDNLKPYDGFLAGDSSYYYTLDYSPQMDPDSTLLGAEQWKWLEQQLLQPADVRIIGSSTQFATQYNGYETWANYPIEQERFVQLIRQTKANGIVFISGDLHYAELSYIKSDVIYDLYDLTSSGLTESWGFSVPNENRIGVPVMENQFGMIRFELNKPEPQIILEIVDRFGQVRIQQAVRLSDLQF